MFEYQKELIKQLRENIKNGKPTAIIKPRLPGQKTIFQALKTKKPNP